MNKPLKSGSPDLPLEGKIVALDPGHGGTDRGKIGASGYVEATGVLDIALKLKQRLESVGAKVVLTREDDTTVSFIERQEKLRAAKPELLLSIHTGAEPYTTRPGGAVCYAANAPVTCWHLAKNILNELHHATGFTSRGIEVCRGNFITNLFSGFFATNHYKEILSIVDIPAVVVECANHERKDEENLLLDHEFRQCCAEGIFRGVFKYFTGFLPQQIEKVEEKIRQIPADTSQENLNDQAERSNDDQHAMADMQPSEMEIERKILEITGRLEAVLEKLQETIPEHKQISPVASVEHEQELPEIEIVHQEKLPTISENLEESPEKLQKITKEEKQVSADAAKNSSRGGGQYQILLPRTRENYRMSYLPSEFQARHLIAEMLKKGQRTEPWSRSPIPQPVKPAPTKQLPKTKRPFC